MTLPIDDRALSTLAGALPSFGAEQLQTIAEYAALKVDTQRMTAIYMRTITQAEIEKAERHTGCIKCRAAPPSTPGMTPLHATPERRLLILTALYHDSRGGFVYTTNYEFERVPGLELVEWCPSGRLRIQCNDIIFYRESWYVYELCTAQLLGALSTALTFLKARGYTPATVPARGQVVVYAHGDRASHYAVIESVDGAGVVMAISKWGSFHVFRHRLDLVPQEHGLHYTLLDRPAGWHGPELYTSPAFIRLNWLRL